MRGYLLRVDKGTFEEVDVENKLDAFYEVLGVRCIDIVTRRVGGITYDIVCDDEALLKNSPKPSLVVFTRNAIQPSLHENLLFLHNDGYGNLDGIDDADVGNLSSHVIIGRDKVTNEAWPVVYME